MFDQNRQYRQDELPGDVFDAGSGNGGNIVNYNGRAVQVYNNGNGTRKLVDNGSWEEYQGKQQAQAASDKYQSAINTAVGGLQTQKSNLGQQYSDLLASVNKEYQPLINQTTATAGAEEAKRGISPDSTLYQQQVQGALQPIQGQEAANYQTIGAGSISDTNTLTNAIASMQAGAAGTSSQLPLQYGALANATALNPSTIASNYGQANYYGGLNANQLAVAQMNSVKPFDTAGVVFNPGNTTFSVAPKRGGGGDAIGAALMTLGKRQKMSRPPMAAMAQYAQ